MNIDQLKMELNRNRAMNYFIRPAVIQEGVLCLIERIIDQKSHKEKHWAVILNERGEFLINKIFVSEHDACRYFFKCIMLDPTCRNIDFPDNIKKYQEDVRELLIQKYGYNYSDVT